MTSKPEQPHTPTVAIIGAGLAGITLALTLQRHAIPCKIYELRADQYSVGGSITLQPNGLRCLDAVGIYSRVEHQGYTITGMNLHNLDSGVVSRESVGLRDAYGYHGLRLSRQILIKEMRDALPERGVEIEYGFRFSHVVAEDESGVSFASTDGVIHTADLLIGADGIHSKVRGYITSAKPEYTGVLGLATTIPRSAVRFPASDDGSKRSFEPPLNMRGAGDMLGLVPCNPDGSELALLRGAHLPYRSREEYDALYADKAATKDLFCRDLPASWPDVARSALEAVTMDSEFIYWPMQKLPELESWISSAGKVVLLGDAAHAIPPTTGQGSNQAFEDALMLGCALGKVGGKIGVADALRFWHEKRRERVYGLIDRLLTKAEGKDPLELRSKNVDGDEEGKRGDAWLYDVKVDGMVDAWAREMS